MTAIAAADLVLAQGPNTTIQLPTFRVTEFRSSFSVPDGGTISIGGVGGGRSSNRRRLTPRNPTNGRSTVSGFGASVAPYVLITEELEQARLHGVALLTRRSMQTPKEINGTTRIQSKADFISRNINRR